MAGASFRIARYRRGAREKRDQIRIFAIFLLIVTELFRTIDPMVIDFLRKALSGLMGALTRLWAWSGAHVLAAEPERPWRASTRS